LRELVHTDSDVAHFVYQYCHAGRVDLEMFTSRGLMGCTCYGEPNHQIWKSDDFPFMSRRGIGLDRSNGRQADRQTDIQTTGAVALSERRLHNPHVCCRSWDDKSF